MKWRGMLNDGLPSVLIATPVLDFKPDIEHMMGIIEVIGASGGSVMPYWLTGNSNIHEARNRIAHHFLKHTPCDTCVWIDSDIVFTLQDFEHLMEGDEEIVIAPYARKVLGKSPVDFGFGFCRTNRSVFQKLADWMAPAEGGGEEEALHRYFNDGELAVDYFYTGASTDCRWFGEDTGFWHWCAMNDFKPRMETRTRLGHVGRLVYRYPEQIPGWEPKNEGAQ